MNVELVFRRELYNKEYDIIFNGNTVGRILFREYKKSINIESISIDTQYQRRGTGSKTIRQLLKSYSTICGCSSPMAIDFWKKLGAEFEYEITESMVYKLLDMGEYPPFMINQ